VESDAASKKNNGADMVRCKSDSTLLLIKTFLYSDPIAWELSKRRLQIPTGRQGGSERTISISFHLPIALRKVLVHVV
jgi:hypothetical protein